MDPTTRLHDYLKANFQSFIVKLVNLTKINPARNRQDKREALEHAFDDMINPLLKDEERARLIYEYERRVRGQQLYIEAGFVMLLISYLDYVAEIWNAYNNFIGYSGWSMAKLREDERWRTKLDEFARHFSVIEGSILDAVIAVKKGPGSYQYWLNRPLNRHLSHRDLLEPKRTILRDAIEQVKVEMVNYLMEKSLMSGDPSQSWALYTDYKSHASTLPHDDDLDLTDYYGLKNKSYRR
ncbi:hypothetical protein BT63DRAFT_464713 [Microthyrium microscopicum]|uniref:Uncharacterized protein n=1 Tax=Microthyrium microscopicum TaxID=703497 RepID=A0A6A6TX00_9PEZI|nr:hypothetical protein BT63DRAFT_464713 [Microthyrium microscopicum]